jgi:hypothetical protein
VSFPPQRFEQAAVAAQARFVGLGGAGGQNLLLPPFVSYVISLGSDRTDAERVVFASQHEFNSGGGNVGSVILTNNHVNSQIDLELVAAFLSRSGGNVNVGMAFEANSLPESLSLDTTSTDASLSQALSAPIGAASSMTHGFATVANVSVFLPLAGVLIIPGRQIRLEGDVLAVAYQGGFIWREIPRRQ